MVLNDPLKYFALIFLVLDGYVVFVYSISRPATCGHRPPKPEEVLHPIYLEPLHVVRKRNADQQLRIKIIYDNSVSKLPPEKLHIIYNTLPAAINYWEQTLRVRPMQTPIRLSRKCEDSKMFYKKGKVHAYCMNSCEKITKCGEVIVPEEHLDICRFCNMNGTDCKDFKTSGEGVTGADFAFYVSAIQTQRCSKGSTIAYAAHCQLEVALDRPIAGHANLCPNAILTRPQDKDTIFSTMKHEILHALGFSLSLFAYYRSKNGEPLTPRLSNGRPPLNRTLQNWQWSDSIIKTVTRSDWYVRSGLMSRTIQMIVTPRVVEEVRRHFNCSSLEGAELEDQGGDGTAMTHWEKRIYENEAMTGIHTQNAIYSRITLALLEDTGWYEPNYHMAEPLLWGQNLGCDFAKKSCLHWMESNSNKSNSIYPYCNIVKKDPLYTSCSMDRKALTVCNLVEYTTELPPIYQNFISLPEVPSNQLAKFGGSLMLADYCPFFQEFNLIHEFVSVRGSKCIYEENSVHPKNNIALEYYGNDSRCFDHSTVSWIEEHCLQSRRKQHYGSGCYKFTCSDGLLNILVDDRSYTCYEKGQELKLSILSNKKLHKGLIMCPACNEICKDCSSNETIPQQEFQNTTDILICKGLNLAENVHILLFMILIIYTYIMHCK